MRERLAELVTRDLGPRQQFEIRQKLRQEVAAERLTSIDRALLKKMAIDRSVEASHRDPFRHALRAGRLRKLEALGLAEPLAAGRWRLAEGLEDQLRALGERGDIIRTKQRSLKASGIERARSEWNLGPVPSAGIVGRIVERGLADELAGRHYLIVDGVDGRIHHVDAGSGDALEPLPHGAIVRLTAAQPSEREVDRRIAEISLSNDGLYSADLHRLADPGASEQYVRAHIRRLEAMRRAGVPVERLGNGTWRIAADHVEQACAYERRRVRAAPVRIDLLSPLALDRLAGSGGATWLDRELAADEPVPLRDSGFGREVRTALTLRRQWLLGEGLAQDPGGEFVMREDAIAALERRGVERAAARIAAERGKPFAEAVNGGLVHGTLVRRVDLAGGRFALVENSREFTLVPWRPVLEHHLGHEVEGIVRQGRVNWSFGRGRAGPEI
jgi:hypothetical protein